MAVPTYATDLTDYDLSEDLSTWFEFTGRAGGASPDEDDDDNAFQGTYMCSQATNIATAFVSMGTTYGGEMSLSAGDVVLVWHQHTSPGAIDTYANDGMQIIIGIDGDNYEGWTVGGSDVFPNPYGGWQNNPVDPTVTADSTVGTPGAYSAVGSSMYMINTVFKGQPHQCDAIRYGRAEARLSGGEAADYATFTGFAAKNDANDAVDGYNRWGLLQVTMGGFLWKGLFTIGYGAACDFRDTNKTIFIQDTRKVTSSFNRITIGYASTNVEWNGISIICASPSTTASKGELEVLTDVVIAMTNCTFIDMNTFVFMSNSTLTTTTFRRCDQVTQGGASFDGCIFEESTADDTASKGALLVNDIADVTDCQFTSTGTGHAVVYRPVGAGPFNVNWDGNIDSDYATVSGSTGDETILIYPDTVDATINLTVINGASTPTIMEHATYTGAFDLIIPSVTLTISSQVTLVGAEIRIYDFESTPPDFGTELEGVESHDAATYAYSGTAANLIYIQIMKDNFVEFGQQVTMPAASGGFYALLITETNS